MVSSMREEENRRAFEAAFEEFLDPLFRFFVYRLSDRERAKELAQETFMRAWEFQGKGGEIQAMKPFLYTIAGNLYKNELRGRRPVVSLDTLLEAGVDFASDAVSAEDRADAKLALERLSGLEPPDREVLTLRYVDGLSTREIAEAQKKSEGAVSVALHRALKRLRVLYQPLP